MHYHHQSSSDNDESSSSFISSIDGSIRESAIKNRGPGPTVDYSRTGATTDAFQLESCRKISELLNTLGYSTFLIEPADVYEYKLFPRGERCIPFSVLHNWSSAVLIALTEILDRLSRQTDKIQSASLSMQFVEVSRENLHQQLDELEKKLNDSERVSRTLRQKILSLEESNDTLNKTNKTMTSDMKRAIKNLEQQIQESERRGRQKEIEINRLKSKLAKVAEKDKEVIARNRAIVADLAVASGPTFPSSVLAASPSHSNSSRQQPGDEDFSSPTTKAHRAGSKTAVSWQSTRGKSPASIARHTQQHGSGGSNSSVSSNLSVDAAVEAFAYERKFQQTRIAELEIQVRSLEKSVADAQNLVTESEKSRRNPHDLMPSPSLAVEENAAESSREMTPTARSMFGKINVQAEAIVNLTQQLEAAQVHSEEKDKEMELYKSRYNDLKEGFENMKLELESRPTARQWSETRRELQELEDKMHDLVTMRGEANELAMWRKHLSTSERIRIDKKNHELGLCLIDALPKQVMKEVLQSVCRDLDITDVSEIPICISKLKMVVKAVPRMERLISQVSDYLFEREGYLLLAHTGRQQQQQSKNKNKNERFSIDDIPKILSRWWQRIERVEELSAFHDAILEELQRHALHNKGGDDGGGVYAEAEVDANGSGRPKWEEISPHLRDPLRACSVIRSLVDFQAEVLNNEDNMQSIISFIKERPDLAVNRIVGHILYVFDIKSVDGILPRMNQLYLFNEEMKNFMAAARALLGAQSKPNAVVIDEIQRRVAITTTMSSLNHGITATQGCVPNLITAVSCGRLFDGYVTGLSSTS